MDVITAIALPIIVLLQIISVIISGAITKINVVVVGRMFPERLPGISALALISAWGLTAHRMRNGEIVNTLVVFLKCVEDVGLLGASWKTLGGPLGGLLEPLRGLFQASRAV